jgi:hypothetical protein
MSDTIDGVLDWILDLLTTYTHNSELQVITAPSLISTLCKSPQHTLIRIVGRGFQLGPVGTAATNRPIVPAPTDYDDGEIGGMIGRGNRSTRRKPAPVPLCPPQTPHATRTRTRAAAVGSQRLTA